MPLISVIAPFLDPEENFFREAIESVRAQTFSDWELLLIDDGSRVQSTSLALRMVESCPDKIFYFEHADHRNLGASAARNLGLRHAAGRYVTFLDADDIWIETKLEQQVAIMEAQPNVGMLFGNTLYWYGWTGARSDASRDFFPELGIKTPALVEPPRYLTLALQGRVVVPCMNSVIVRSDALRLCGGFDDSFRGLYDDQVFYAKFLLFHPVYVMSECWDKYRQHPNSMCAQASTLDLERAHFHYLKWLIGYLVEHGYEGTRIWRVARVEYMICSIGGVGRFYRRLRRLIRRLPMGRTVLKGSCWLDPDPTERL